MMARLVAVAHDLTVDIDDIASLDTTGGKTTLAMKSGKGWTWDGKAEHVRKALAPFLAQPMGGADLSALRDEYQRGYNAGYKAGKRGKAATE